MPGKRTFTFFVLITILILIVSSIAPVRVFADDATPPPEATEESAGTSGDSSSKAPDATSDELIVPSGDPSSEISEATPVANPATQDGAVGTNEPVVEEAATEVPAAMGSTEGETSPIATGEAVASDATLDATSPQGMNVKVVDAQGQAVALDGASADMILDSTPIWCPDGSEPMPGQNGCTDTFGLFEYKPTCGRGRYHLDRGRCYAIC
jgi:hypothetical protein